VEIQLQLKFVFGWFKDVFVSYNGILAYQFLLLYSLVLLIFSGELWLHPSPNVLVFLQDWFDVFCPVYAPYNFLHLCDTSDKVDINKFPHGLDDHSTYSCWVKTMAGNGTSESTTCSRTTSKIHRHFIITIAGQIVNFKASNNFRFLIANFYIQCLALVFTTNWFSSLSIVLLIVLRKYNYITILKY
jgi:hypothetical protein